MKNYLAGFIFIAALLAVLGAIIWWNLYKFQDCKHVGHTTFYCLMMNGD